MKRFIVWLFVAITCCSLPVMAQNDSVPFLYRSHLYLRSTINDTVNLNIVFDTGGSDIFGVDSVWLKHSNWIPKYFGKASMGSGDRRIIVPLVVDYTKVVIGNIEEYYNRVPVFKLRDVVDCHVDGIWGIKNIAEYPLEINYEKGYLKRYKTGKPNTEGYERMPIRYENDRIMLQVETVIGGTVIRGWYLMDTGAGGSVEFTSKTTSEYRLDTICSKRHFIDWSNYGLGNKKQEGIVKMMSDRIVLGNDTFIEKPVKYIPEGTGAFGDKPYLGIIGNDILSNYNMIVDAKNSVLYLRRFASDEAPTPTYDYSFRNRTDIGSGWIVSMLYRDGEAANAGMALGDTIKAVNGRPVSDYSWEEEHNLSDTPRQVLDIAGTDGQEKRIVLEAKLLW